MFKIEDDPQGFKRLTISGAIDADEMQAGLDAFLGALEEGKHTHFLYTITDFQFPPLDALAVEFRYLPQLLTSMSKIGRIAVVADQEWLRTAAGVEGALIPGLDIRAFEPGEEDAATSWLVAEDDFPV